jgi:hypothetical protein
MDSGVICFVALIRIVDPIRVAQVCEEINNLLQNLHSAGICVNRMKHEHVAHKTNSLKTVSRSKRIYARWSFWHLDANIRENKISVLSHLCGWQKIPCRK